MPINCPAHGYFERNTLCPTCEYENGQALRPAPAQHGAGADFSKALTDKKHPYHALATALLSAYEQAAMGKGKERHAQERPFTEQPMQTISDLVGDHNGLAYQAIKKIQESQRLPHDRAIAELRGAIVYTAGNVIYREKHHG